VSDSTWIDDFLAEERLPASFRLTLERVCLPLADFGQARREELGGTAVIGLCGAQGSGKSTAAAAAVRLLEGRGLSAVSVSLDDFYLPRAARERLARDVHPLFATRGPPGTHDTGLACTVLDQLRLPGQVALPTFDKAADEPRPRSEWREFAAPADIAFIEGWCVGAAPQPVASLLQPTNTLEAVNDPDARWRLHVNAQLTGPYRSLFGRLDGLALLQAPNFEVVLGWRREQEQKLRDRTGRGMTGAELARFVAHYERLTRWILREMPKRADLVFRLDEDRSQLL
jgi:D-glycerate 3-kinase